MPSDTPPAFPRLVYRYLFFGWLFRDVTRGGWIEREAALRYNRERAAWLPMYVRRWAVLCLVFYAVGIALEQSGLQGVAPIAFVTSCLGAPVMAVAAAGWVVLRTRAWARRESHTT